MQRKNLRSKLSSFVHHRNLMPPTALADYNDGSETMDHTAVIKIGGTETIVNTNKIPYFESFLRFHRSSGHDPTTVPVHEAIPFFQTINFAITNGFRHFFRRIPVQLNDYHALCEQLRFLCIDVVGGRDMSAILRDMRQGKRDWDPQERREIKGFKTIARDSAFRLLYLFLVGEFESDVRDSNMAYQTALFVVSHRAIFKRRARYIVREALLERFRITWKQRQGLDKWPVEEPTSQERTEDDATTEDEEDSDFGSDWS